MKRNRKSLPQGGIKMTTEVTEAVLDIQRFLAIQEYARKKNKRPSIRQLRRMGRIVAASSIQSMQVGLNFHMLKPDEARVVQDEFNRIAKNILGELMACYDTQQIFDEVMKTKP